MDNRLRRVQKGIKAPSELTNVKLPELARGVTALIRKQGSITHIPACPRYVRLRGSNYDAVLLLSDWVKVKTLIANQTLDPQAFPVETGFRRLDPVTHFDEATLDSKDPLYSRVLFYLGTLFSDQVPTL